MSTTSLTTLCRLGSALASSQVDFHDLTNFCRTSLRTTIVNLALDFVLYLLEGFSRMVPDQTFDIPSELGVTEVLEKLVPQ